MRVLVTGSRKWQDDRPVVELLQRLLKRVHTPSALTFVHGGSGGLDWMVDVLGRHMKANVECHPAHWHKHGEAAVSICNQEMVDLGADVVFAFPLATEAHGMTDCIERAVKAGIPVMVYDPELGEYAQR
jgi:hypothetical protein